ncbi:GMC oxidoreductase [Colletotrichum gloeosporioides Cg-14]|uniref:GMC oxidoreductase n=1 Tax=Colletotrichum gloeosporioides (strain Cg-14) TaxID=1237896 RepID=T0KEE5_COLGC|nr:GMC oxidoreductase [Colletotrichum gloeosporioides Cg-14]
MRYTISGAAALLGLAGSASAQLRASAYTDPQTGIDFQRYKPDAYPYSFGIAVPETTGTDFIGQMVVPISTKGNWGAVSLKGGMLNGLLFVAWADGEDIVTSFRMGSAYSNPDVYTKTEVKATPIANGTFVNSTHFSYTFLCSNCVDSTATTLAGESPILGWAFSDTSPTTPSDPASALNYHSAGFGQFGLDIASAKSAKFEEWSKYAKEVETTPVPGNGTTTPVPGNSTTPITTSNSTYDVIVVGGGPAGIIAAERIAESGASVLLIERGPANTVPLGSDLALPWNDTLTPYDIPALGSSMTSLSGISMCSDTASTAGCLLGGSSSINGLNFIHPPEHDFQRWPKGWNWADMSAAAERLYERNPGTTEPSDDKKYYDDLTYRVLSGLLSGKGWKEVDSIESPNEKQAVFSRPSCSCPTSPSKLETKVIQVERTGSTITGVLTQAADGSKQIIKVNQGGKVVLAAGAMSSPPYPLELRHRQGAASTGVTLPAEADWIDLPVGHHLQDHAQVMLQFNSQTNFTAYGFNAIASNPVTSDLALYKEGSGPITQAAQRMHLWTSAEGADGRTRYLQGTASAMQNGIITVRTFLTHGTSTLGELGISASGNTVLNTKPWLIDTEDRKAMSDFVQYWLDLTSGSNSTLSYVTPGATPEDIISTKMISGDHWVGSAKMGTDDGRSGNGTAVVDLDTKAIIMITAEHAAEKIAAFKVSGSGSNSTTTPTPENCKRSEKRAARQAMRFRRHVHMHKY